MTTQLPPAKVLSVDDTPANLLVMRELLDPLGYDVLEASSGQAALDLAARHEFALFLLDVMMPGMDGLETLARLRKTARAPQTPVILVTAATPERATLQRAYALGAVDYIEKPIAAEVLRGKVRALVSLWEVTRDLRTRDAELALKDRHLAILAHDLRNPLSTVVGAGHLVLRAKDLEGAKRAADRVLAAGNRMSAMIRDLLDHARATGGALPMSRGPADLGALAHELAEEFHVADATREISVAVSGPVSGEWDVARVYQALSNLLGNATRYGRGRARLTVKGDAEFVDVEVFNDGPPIPQELLPVLFEPFQRGHTDNSGLGLGLYIVEVIARSHGGAVTVESSAEAGTTFVLRLPRRPLPDQR